ncbi:unnamed protein product [Boreogadus saida]
MHFAERMPGEHLCRLPGRVPAPTVCVSAVHTAGRDRDDDEEEEKMKKKKKKKMKKKKKTRTAERRSEPEWAGPRWIPERDGCPLIGEMAAAVLPRCVSGREKLKRGQMRFH